MIVLALVLASCAEGTTGPTNAPTSTQASVTTVEVGDAPAATSTTMPSAVADFITWEDPAYLELVDIDAVAIDVTATIERIETVETSWTDIVQGDAYQRSAYDGSLQQVRTFLSFGERHYELVDDGWKPLWLIPETDREFRFPVRIIEPRLATFDHEPTAEPWIMRFSAGGITDRFEWLEDESGAVFSLTRETRAPLSNVSLEYTVRPLDAAPLVEPTLEDFAPQFAEFREFDYLFAVMGSFFRWRSTGDSRDMDLTEAQAAADKEEVNVRLVAPDDYSDGAVIFTNTGEAALVAMPSITGRWVCVAVKFSGRYGFGAGASFEEINSWDVCNEFQPEYLDPYTP